MRSDADLGGPFADHQAQEHDDADRRKDQSGDQHSASRLGRRHSRRSPRKAEQISGQDQREPSSDRVPANEMRR